MQLVMRVSGEAKLFERAEEGSRISFDIESETPWDVRAGGVAVGASMAFDEDEDEFENDFIDPDDEEDELESEDFDEFDDEMLEGTESKDESEEEEDEDL